MVKSGGEMNAESIRILNFSASGVAWGHFGRPLGARRRKEQDFVVQDAARDGPRRLKGHLQDTKRAHKEAPRKPKESQRGFKGRFWQHFCSRNDAKLHFLTILSKTLILFKSCQNLSKAVDF